MLIQNCSFEGDEILFISVLAVTNRETAWFRVIVLMAPSVLFPFLVGLQTQNWTKGRTPSPRPQWLVEEDDPNQPIQALFRVFQTSKQIWDDIILEGPTVCLPCGGRPCLSEEERNQCTKTKMLYKMGSVMCPWLIDQLHCCRAQPQLPFHSVRNHPRIRPLILFYVLSVASVRSILIQSF